MACVILGLLNRISIEGVMEVRVMVLHGCGDHTVQRYQEL